MQRERWNRSVGGRKTEWTDGVWLRPSRWKRICVTGESRLLGPRNVSVRIWRHVGNERGERERTNAQAWTQAWTETMDRLLGEFAQDTRGPLHGDLRRRPFDLVGLGAGLLEHLEPGLHVQARQLLEAQVRFVWGCDIKKKSFNASSNGCRIIRLDSMAHRWLPMMLVRDF